MKADLIEMACSKIGIALVLAVGGSMFDPLSQFVLLYNPFFGILGVMGNVISYAISKIKSENRGVEQKKKSRAYHIATFTIAFIIPIMLTTYVSNFFHLEKIICAFLIGLSTSFIDQVYDAFKKVVLGELKEKTNE